MGSVIERFLHQSAHEYAGFYSTLRILGPASNHHSERLAEHGSKIHSAGSA